MFFKLIKVILINISIICCLYISLEIVFRAFFPEFRNEIFTESETRGIKIVHGKFYGIDIRVPFNGYRISTDKKVPIVLMLGDSISDGYGTIYEDIYWRKFERLMNLSGDSKIQVLSLSGYGNNLTDSLNNLKSLVNKASDKISIKYVIYQFNFNDINPFNKMQLKKGEHLGYIERTNLFKNFQLIRVIYLNRSVFFRVMMFYSGELKRKIQREIYGSCKHKGYNALYEFTWTFGFKPYKIESEDLWNEFESSIIELKQFCDKINARFIILVSPIIYDVDTKGYTPYYNFRNMNFDCATINPRERLIEIKQKLNIDLIDPKDYLKDKFDRIILEGNFEPFYFPADYNHFTPIASGFIAEYMYYYFENKVLTNSLN